MTKRKVKLTGGGTFMPTDDFIYFAAGAPNSMAGYSYPWVLIATNDLNRELGPDPLMELILKASDTIMLDSGVFWLSTQHAKKYGLSMDDALSVAPEAIDDFDWLYARYVDVVQRYESRLWGYVEIDQGGAENKRRTRAKLERAGLRPIPVYHPLVDGWDYFDELASQYDRICVGNIVQANTKTRVRILATIWERKRRLYPNLWVHALGLTPNESSNSYPTNSADSSSWSYAFRYGAPSAPGPHAMLKSFGRFGHEHSYAQDVDAEHARGYEASVMWQLNEARFRQQIWQDSARDLRELLDEDVRWPKALPGEKDPAPRTVEVS